MQCAIDNAKRRFDIDIMREIRRIKKDMNVNKYNHPIFWKLVQPNCKCEVNKQLKCPMNYLFQLKIKEYKSVDSTLPMNYFFIKYDIDKDKKQCKKVEQVIQKYSLNLYQSDYQSDSEQFILMREDFDNLINDLRQIYLSNNYLGLTSWLINRAFIITGQMQLNGTQNKTQLDLNKSILLKVLYKNNPKNLLKIFSKNAENV